MGPFHWSALLAIFFLLFTEGLSMEQAYCDFYKGHDLCIYPEYNSTNCREFREMAPDAQQQKIIVDWHNERRNKVAKGEETRGFEGPPPPAANMMKMYWDPELAKIAQRWANQCLYGHNCNECRRVVGGRFAVGQSISSLVNYDRTKFDFAEAMKPWYESEVEKVWPELVDYYFKDKAYGHYSQVVWWNTRSVGCGAASYIFQNSKYYEFFLVCNYGAAANLPEVKMYEKGQACSKCPKDTECDSTYNGLCAITKTPFNVTEEFGTDKVYLGLDENRHIEV